MFQPRSNDVPPRPAKQKGLVSPEDAQRVLDVYAKLKLPCSIAGIDAETYKTAVREITVHRDGLLRAPLPLGIGEPYG